MRPHSCKSMRRIDELALTAKLMVIMHQATERMVVFLASANYFLQGNNFFLNLTINEEGRESWLLGKFRPHAGPQDPCSRCQSQNSHNLSPFPLPPEPISHCLYFHRFWLLL